jgi:hypothetical protein
MGVIEIAQIGKLGLDVRRRTDEPSRPHESLSAAVDGTAKFFPVQLNPKSIDYNCTIPGTANAMSVGPIVINDGVTVTVADGAVWVII